MAESTDFKRTRRPPRDKSRARHPPKRRSIVSKTGCHSRVVIRPSTRGSPKYRIGKDPAGVSSMRAHLSLSSADIPNPMKVDLARLRLRPEKSENNSNRAETFSAAATEPSIKKIVSSSYCNKGTPPGHPVVWKPASSPPMHSLPVHTVQNGFSIWNNAFSLYIRNFTSCVCKWRKVRKRKEREKVVKFLSEWFLSWSCQTFCNLLFFYSQCK